VRSSRRSTKTSRVCTRSWSWAGAASSPLDLAKGLEGEGEAHVCHRDPHPVGSLYRRCSSSVADSGVCSLAAALRRLPT
jgi:hypothetical protein